MKARIILATIILLMCSSVGAGAQKRRYLRIKESPLVWFDFDCTTEAAYPRARLDRKVKPYLTKIPYEIGKWGNRAFRYDLNGDGVKEVFVVLDCGGTGNCDWEIFSISPRRLLGIVNGENIWIHKRMSGWSKLTVGSHLNVSESLLRTYRFERGRYRRFGKDYIASAYRKNSPQNLFTVEPTCDPHWIAQEVRK